MPVVKRREIFRKPSHPQPSGRLALLLFKLLPQRPKVPKIDKRISVPGGVSNWYQNNYYI
jgi:hypothetical protein